MCHSMVFVFFFKQKTAYEVLRSLVGSEMCIRDSHWIANRWARRYGTVSPASGKAASGTTGRWARSTAVSYTHLTLPTIYSV